MTGADWSYVELSSGRYLCSEHGAFCDPSDNFSLACPLCPEEALKEWRVNKVQRTLRVINGLQERSKRNVTLVSTVFGGLSILKLLQSRSAGSVDSRLNDFSFSSGCAGILLLTAVITLLSSIALFASSMNQISVTHEMRVPSKSLEGWEKFMETKLGLMEISHKFGGYSFVLSVVLFATSLLIYSV